MDKNNNYFDLDNMQHNNEGGEKGCSPQKGGEQKSFFLSGIIVGMTAALLIISLIYFATRVQAILELGRNGARPEVTAQQRQQLSEEQTTILNKIESLEALIHEAFYLGEVTQEELHEGIYRGMLEALNDPYSEYYTVEELEQLMEQTQGTYSGIGAYVSIDTTTTLPKISGVIEGTPAAESDLRANDIIYQIDGEFTQGMTLTEAVSYIKGLEGTQVELTIVREGESDYLDFVLTRRRVEAKTVNFEMLDNGMANIQITEFDDVTIDQFAEALAMAKGSGMKGLILDLRANPGGSLTAVVEIARMLLPEGLVVYTEDVNGTRQEYTCDGTRRLDVPMVVLVDMNSASASEILAGAIQDYGTGTLVGTTTFGKGIVQQIFLLDDGSAAKLTISSYYTPEGRDIHGVGITPDVEIEFDGEAYYGSEERPDNQLEKAKEVLTEMINTEE